MKKIEARDLLKQGTRYLPSFLKDFHGQKDVFKVIWDSYMKAQALKKAQDYYHREPLNGMTWVSSHVYVIDYFLWFMALYGYTLQKDRRITPSRSLEEDIGNMRAEELGVLTKMLDNRG